MKKTMIECDGGTPCNNPRIGYGDGYGSYRIDKGKVVRVDFKKPMSVNEAEVSILICAIEDAISRFGKNQSFEILSDSKIIVNCVNFSHKKKKFSLGCSEGYKNGVSKLRELLDFFQASASWISRNHMVSIFGH